MLGGGLEGAINLARGGYELNSGGDRFVEAAVLARRFPDAKVLVSGGTGTLVLEGEGDADTAPRLLAALGVAAERLILENKSRNTYENAQFTKELVNPQPGETWLLVTSAFHMPRSMGLFRKVGFPGLAVAGRLPHLGQGRRRPVPRQRSRFAAEHDDRRSANGSGSSPIGSPGRIDSVLPGPA